MNRFVHCSLACLAIFSYCAVAAATESQDRSGVGIRIRSFSLKDQRGKPVSLKKVAEGHVTVVVFLGTECPLAVQYGPRLCDLAKEFEPKGVVFLAIDSNHQDTKTDISRFAQMCELKFSILRDQSNMIADHFGAKRTPEAFVLDKDLVVRYRGRIDDQYGIKNGINFKRSKPERRDLAVALEEVLAKKAVSVPVTVGAGCLIGRAPKNTTDGAITYASHIATIFNKRCVECHRAGEAAPFSMAKYEDFAGWGEMIREVVDSGLMPPWHADPKHGTFKNDSRLDESEKKLILDWVDSGCPQGDPAKTPKPPRFAKGWQISDRKQVFWMTRDKRSFEVPAEGKVDYKYFTIDPGFTEDKWVQSAEARAGDPSVVHHIIVFVEPPGTKHGAISFDGFLAATAPGARPMMLPPGMAKRVPAGSKLKFQMHYTPNGKATKDLSAVALVYADPASVKTLVRTEAAMNVVFKIPPAADDFPVKSQRTFHKDAQLLSLYPHMHLRGKAFRYTARYPGGKEEVLLDIPRYDFNWQNTYELTQPISLPKGTEIRCEARFDNSKSNPANPDSTKPVFFGEQTYEEMMIGFMDVAYPRDRAAEVSNLAKSKARRKAATKAAAGKAAKSASARSAPPSNRPAG